MTWLDANPEMKAKMPLHCRRAALRAAFAACSTSGAVRLQQAVLAMHRSRCGTAVALRAGRAAAAVLAVGGLGGYFAGIDGSGHEGGAEDQLASSDRRPVSTQRTGHA